nr:hypothetical protein 3 [Piscirickettsiaceae bacterium]
MTNERLAIMVGELKQQVTQLKEENQQIKIDYKELKDLILEVDAKLLDTLNDKVLPYLHSHKR